MRIEALNSFRFMPKDFHQEDGHSLDLDQKRSGILLLRCKPQGRMGQSCRADDVKIRRKHGTKLQSWLCENSAKVNTQSSDPQVHCLRGVLKSKGGGKLSIHLCADEGTIETVLRKIISVNQLSIYGAVSDLCDECKSCHVRTGRRVLVGQSVPLFVPTSVLMKTPKPLTDHPAQASESVARLRMERLSTESSWGPYRSD